jgi:hypothetical protein
MQPQNWGLPSYISLKLLCMVSSVYECEIFNIDIAVIPNEARGARDICRAIGSSFLPFDQVF